MGDEVATMDKQILLVFDSGLGGLTVCREIMRALPQARYVYVADDAFFPYGGHGEAELNARVVPLMGDLIACHNPSLVVIACNTASTLSLDHLRAAYDVPFVGTVPAIKPACAGSRTRRVAVLGTQATVTREYTKALIRDFAQGCAVDLVGSAHLATLAEAMLHGEPVDDEAIMREIAPCFIEAAGRRTDTIVLACTHFPLLLARLTALAPWPVAWIDPAPAIARRVSALVRGDGAAIAQDPPARCADITYLFTSGRAFPADLARAGIDPVRPGQTSA